MSSAAAGLTGASTCAGTAGNTLRPSGAAGSAPGTPPGTAPGANSAVNGSVLSPAPIGSTVLSATGSRSTSIRPVAAGTTGGTPGANTHPSATTVSGCSVTVGGTPKARC